MLHQLLQHTLSQLLAPARPGPGVTPMAATVDGRIVPVALPGDAVRRANRTAPTGTSTARRTDRVRHHHGYVTVTEPASRGQFWLDRCAAVMATLFGAGIKCTVSGNPVIDGTQFGPAEPSQPPRSVKT